MNPSQRLSARIRGEAVDRLPNLNILMTFAAQHIGQPLSAYYLDHKVLVEANLAAVEDFGLDIVQAISDPYREATGFGLEVDFPDDGLPVSKVPLLAEPEDLLKLRPPDPTLGRMGDRLEAIRLFREKVGGEVPIMGWVEGALAEATDLRMMSELFMDLALRPEWVEDLLEMCTETAIVFARAQIEAGADIIGLGDAAASQISPMMYRRFALPYEQRIFQAVREMGALPRLHICGDTGRIVKDMVNSGAAIVDLDWMVDMQAAAEQFGERVTFLGNYDPVAVMYQGTPQAVYDAVLTAAQQGGPRSIPAAGCEIPMDTPQENLQAHARALRALGTLGPNG